MGRRFPHLHGNFPPVLHSFPFWKRPILGRVERTGLAEKQAAD
jgi:hypothetical protein